MPDLDSTDVPVTRAAAEADRVLKIQDTILAAFRAATEAHKAASARIATLESDNAGLQALIAELESQAPNLVDPAALQPALDDLAGAVAATHAAIVPAGAGSADASPQA